jgi:hypothetical protein
MRPIIFVKYYDKGSTDLGGHQLSEAFQARGILSETIYAKDLGAVGDSILVFIKTSRLPHLIAAKRRRNLLVADLHDTLVFKRSIKHRFLYDGIVFRNTRQYLDYGSPPALETVVHHHWDSRYAPNRATDGFRIAYLGHPRSMRWWNAIEGVEFVPEPWFPHAPDFNCHLSIREPGREWLYKPNTKVSTAAACMANIITTRDDTALEYLGADYPYYTEPDLPSIYRTIEYARRTYGTEIWRQGLQIMRGIRERTTIDSELDQYLAFFGSLEKRAAA